MQAALAAIMLAASIVNGAVGYGFSSITVPVALLFLSNRALNPALVPIEIGVHEQYTRNMATGASTADLAIVVVDARHGVRSSRAPTRRLLGCSASGTVCSPSTR